MEIQFEKYQGTGNDFILIDNRNSVFPEGDLELVRKMCHRKWGIGADGLMLIQAGTTNDFEMVFFNPDGSKSLCGNGSRCAIAYASSLGIIQKDTVFTTTDGEHRAFLKNGLIHFQVRDVSLIEQKSDSEFFIENGSPHHVKFVENVDKVDIMEEGVAIRHDDSYAPAGTNVNFVSVKDNQLHVRTFERGVEAETLSCGTGVVASALAASFRGFSSPVKVNTSGGQLKVSFETDDSNHFKEVFLSGPAKKVFEGVYTFQD